jgi:hypothetical protein
LDDQQYSDTLKDLIFECLYEEPEHRPSLQEIKTRIGNFFNRPPPPGSDDSDDSDDSGDDSDDGSSGSSSTPGPGDDPENADDNVDQGPDPRTHDDEGIYRYEDDDFGLMVISNYMDEGGPQNANSHEDQGVNPGVDPGADQGADVDMDEDIYDVSNYGDEEQLEDLASEHDSGGEWMENNFDDGEDENMDDPEDGGFDEDEDLDPGSRGR